MKVKRIVANIETEKFEAVKVFYGDLLGLEVLMDMGWILTMGTNDHGPMQMTFASEGGSNTPVPKFSIEVDDLDAALTRFLDAGIEPEYGPVDEPWGIRRFFVRDPLNQLVNISVHLD